jgi:hypothetical protein
MREFKDGEYEPWSDYPLGADMVAGDRVSYTQYVESLIKLFTENGIRHRMMRIRKWTHNYLRTYVHKDDLEKLRGIINANIERNHPRGITCIAGRV